MKDDRYLILGKYVASLSQFERAYAGRLINVALPFILSGAEFSKNGKEAFLKLHPDMAYGTKLNHLNDFLYFAGVRLGRQRRQRVKVLQKKQELSARNQADVAAFMKWLDGRKDYSERTLYTHETGIRHFFQYADEFSQELARRYVATLEEKGLSPKTINIRILTLRLFGDFKKKPVDIKKHKVIRALCVENVPTEKEYQLLLEWCRANDPHRMFWVVRLLGSTGMRLSELRMIQWKHVMAGEAYLKCKGSKYRWIYFPKQVMAEAKEYVRDNGFDPERYVVVNRRGEPLGNRCIGAFFHLVAEKSGYPKEKAHCHALRHFFAKMYLKKSGDVIQLAELLGHESVDTTRIYLQKSKAEHVKDVNRNVIW